MDTGFYTSMLGQYMQTNRANPSWSWTYIEVPVAQPATPPDSEVRDDVAFLYEALRLAHARIDELEHSPDSGAGGG